MICCEKKAYFTIAYYNKAEWICCWMWSTVWPINYGGDVFYQGTSRDRWPYVLPEWVSSRFSILFPNYQIPTGRGTVCMCVRKTEEIEVIVRYRGSWWSWHLHGLVRNEVFYKQPIHLWCYTQYGICSCRLADYVCSKQKGCAVIELNLPTCLLKWEWSVIQAKAQSYILFQLSQQISPLLI